MIVYCIFIFLRWLKTWLVTLRDGAEIHLQCCTSAYCSGFRRQSIQRLMVTLNRFPQEESDKSENNRSVGTLLMAGSYPKCTVGEPNLIFFFSIPLALFSNNYSSKKHLAACFSSKGVADFISFFWDYRDYYKTSNCPCPSVEDLNGAMRSCDLNFVFSTMSSQKLFSDV